MPIYTLVEGVPLWACFRVQ